MPTKRERQLKLFRDIFDAALAAGVKDANEVQCVPMVVGTPTTPFGDQIDETKKTYFVADGVCGFGWAVVRPGTSAFAKWLVKNGHGRQSNYERGVVVSSPLRTQSLTRNEEFAHAFANVINKIFDGRDGVVASGYSRID